MFERETEYPFDIEKSNGTNATNNTVLRDDHVKRAAGIYTLRALKTSVGNIIEEI